MKKLTTFNPALTVAGASLTEIVPTLPKSLEAAIRFDRAAERSAYGLQATYGFGAPFALVQSANCTT